MQYILIYFTLKAIYGLLDSITLVFFFLVFALFTIHLACFVADREAGTCCWFVIVFISDGGRLFGEGQAISVFVINQISD